MDIINFTKNIKYDNFTHDIVRYFSQNAAVYAILKNNSDSIKVDAFETIKDKQITYIISSTTFDLNKLIDLVSYPVTIFGSTHIPKVVKTKTQIKVIFNL